MREWFEMTPRGVPGTFEVVMTVGSREGVPATAQYVADIRAEVDRAKRGTAHYIFKQGYSAIGTQQVGAGARAAVYRRLSLSET